MVDLDELEEWLLQNDSPVVTSSEVADAMDDCSRRQALEDLKLLKRAETVESKDVGARAVAWWHVDRVTPPRVDPAEHPAQTALEEAREESKTRFEQHAEQRIQQIADDDPLAAVEFPSGKDREECVEAVRAAESYVLEHGSATMRDFVADVLPEHPVGYEIVDLEPGDRYRGAWWRRVVKPGLKALPTVEPPADGQSDWTSAE